MSLADATRHVPFSNGTEGDVWMARWCELCVRDHDMHPPDDHGPGCSIMCDAMVGGADWRWPEAWLPEPDDGEFALPSRLVCLAFEPCTEDGCQGDPGAGARAERVAEVTAYWRDRR